ncbi:uncharacterized protein [Leptinotarsa decemlineata]|uniref:uncharacterized protein n=1 Tax=Leptinotarsa decemlineata TaxID=7539 RepID=UPI003D30B34C
MKLNICNIYIPPNQDPTEDELTNLFGQIPSPRLIVGDFNAHNHIWESEKITVMGQKIERVINNLQLNILNDGRVTRFNSANGDSSAIDLTLCESELSISLDWEVLPELFASDHFPIIINNENYRKPYNVNPRWRLKQSDWTNFVKYIENDPIMSDTEQILRIDVNQMIETFCQTITKAAEKYVGKSSISNKYPALPWWNDECQIAVKLAKKAFNTFKRHKTPENMPEFKRLRARARYAMKMNKRKCWQEFVAGINNSTPIGDIWKMVKRISGTRNHSMINYVNYNGSSLTSPQDIADALASTLQKHSSNETYTSQFITRKLVEESTPLSYDQLTEAPMNYSITMKELSDILEERKNFKPVPDDIPIIFLKMLPQNAKELLLKMYNV